MPIWTGIVGDAKRYDYAEQDASPLQFKHWPDSRYILGFDANNSNTFIRYLVKRACYDESFESSQIHPGRSEPRKDKHEYRWFGVPFKE
jgi:hypothetical protein